MLELQRGTFCFASGLSRLPRALARPPARQEVKEVKDGYRTSGNQSIPILSSPGRPYSAHARNDVPRQSSPPDTKCPLAPPHHPIPESSKAPAVRRKGAPSKTKAKVDAGKGNSGVISSAHRNPHGHGHGLAGIAVSGGVGGPGVGWGVGGGAGKDGGGAAGGGGGATSLAAAAAAKAEEKRRHNLELRRINRAWNASLPLRRAEEEVSFAALP